MPPELSELSEGQRSFYETLLADDPQAADDFLNAVILEKQRDLERVTPPPVTTTQGDVIVQPPGVIPEVAETESFVGPPSPTAARTTPGLDESDVSFYEQTYEDDPEAADQFLSGRLEEIQNEAGQEPESLPPLNEQRTILGFPQDGKIPEPPANLDESIGQFRNLQQAQQLIIPDLLDAETKKGYLSAIERYVEEGFPDEGALSLQYGIEFDNQYLQRTGSEPPDENSFNPASNKYSLEKATFVRGELDKIPGETAQSKAREQFFGVKSPRKPRSVTAFESTPTPVRPGLIQRNPELADDMSLGQLATAALSPQVITTAKETQREKDKRGQEKTNLVNSLIEFAKEEKLDLDNNEQRRDARQQFFTLYRNDLIDALISQQLGPIEGISPTSAPFFFGLSREEMDDLVKEVTPQANVITRGAIKIVFRPEDAKGRLAPNATEQSLVELFPVPQSTLDTVYKQIFDPAVTVASEGLQALVTTKYSPQMRQMLFEGGYVENPDAITESAGMTIVRDVAGLLRLVVNPAVSGAENLGIIDRKTPEEEVDTILPAARREYTEQVEFDIANPIDSMTNLGEAYLKEVLVETATMRSLGNDIAQTDSILGFEVSDDVRDGLVIAGTAAEFFIPIGKAGAVKALGAPTKAASKAPRALTRAIKQRTLRPTMVDASRGVEAAEGISEFALNVVAGGGNPLFALTKAGADYLPGLAARATTSAVAANDISKLARTIDNGEVIAKAFDKTGFKDLLRRTATVEAKVLDNLSEPIQALEIRARGGAGALDDAVRDGVIGPRAAGIAESLSPAQAEKALQEMVTSKTEVISSMAERAMVGSQRETYTLEKALQRRTQIRGAGAEEMTKFGLGDYVMLTDKTVVKQSWLDKNSSQIDELLIDTDGKSKLFEVLTEPGDAVTKYGFKPGQQDFVYELAVKTGDDTLRDIAERGMFAVDDAIYVTQRVMDDAVLRLSDTAFEARKAKTIQAATEPLERRANDAIIKNFYEAFVPVNVKKLVDNGIKKFMNKPTVKQAQTAETSATTLRFTNKVDDSIARLDRRMKGAYGNTARNIDGIDDAVMRDLGGAFLGEVSGLRRLGTKTAKVYQSVYLIQAKTGATLADISKYTPQQFSKVMQEILNTPITDNAAKYINQQTFENYLNVIYGTDLRSNEAIAELLNNYNTRLGNNPFELIPEFMAKVEIRFPEIKVNKVKNPNDALASMTADMELRTVLRDAIRETFAADEFAAPLKVMRNRVPGDYAVLEDQMIDLVEALTELRYSGTGVNLNTMTAEDALIILQKTGLKKAFDYANRPQIRYSPQQFLAEIDGGVSNSLADYLEVTALKRGISVNDLRNNYGYQLRQIVEETRQIKLKVPTTAYPLSELEKKAIETYTRKLGSKESKVINDNFSKLQRNQDIFEYSTGMMNYLSNGMRRTFVSGQLGGKYLPNIPYQMENLLTAGIITYVTNPKYVATVLGQTVQSTLGLTPYRKLRYMASAKPNTILPGTRFTYEQVYEAFQTKNLGVSNAGLNLGDSFYRDLTQEAAGWNRFTQGVPGYQALPPTLKEGGDWFRGFASYFNRATQDLMQGPTELAKPFSPTTSPYMKWADETDRAFREAIFVKSLQNGDSIETAAKLSREVMLDYGMMPGFARQGIMKSALYLSYTVASSAEMFKAMTTTNGALRVAAMASYHRDLNRYFGAYYSGGDRTLESLYMKQTDDPNVLNTYMRSPYLGSLINVGKLTGYGVAIGTGRSEDTVQRAKEGIADFLYIPMLDFARDLDTEFKRGVPAKQMMRIMDESFPAEFITTNPLILALKGPQLMATIMSDGGNPFYFIDRYDIEVRPTEKRIPGSPTFGGYQYRFRSKEGYNNYLIDQGILSLSGMQRGFNDYYNALVGQGIITVPQNVDLNYQGPLQKPILTPGADYLLLKGRAVKLPKDIELEYRALKESERRLIDKQKVFEK